MTSSTYSVKIHSHSPEELVRFLHEVVGMNVLHEYEVSTESLQRSFGWPPSEATRGWMLGEGDRGMVQVFDVPLSLRDTVPDGLGMVSFTTDDLASTVEQAQGWASGDVRHADTGVPGVSAALCDVLNVPIEFLEFSDPAT
jgi:hypothetical protein